MRIVRMKPLMNENIHFSGILLECSHYNTDETTNEPWEFNSIKLHRFPSSNRDPTIDIK